VEDGRSPVPLPSPLDGGSAPWKPVVLWAYVPGYSWGRLEVHLTTSGERLLVLPRGGALEVTLANFQLPAVEEVGTTVRIRQAPQKSVEEAPVSKLEAEAAIALLDSLSKVPEEQVPEGKDARRPAEAPGPGQSACRGTARPSRGRSRRG
jgi:hypothetical protein